MKAPKPTERQVRTAVANQLAVLQAENAKLRSALRFVQEEIEAFDGECRRACYTDTGRAWELLNQLNAKATEVLASTDAPESPAPVAAPVEDFWVLKAMRGYGGGFVNALSEAALRADDDNLRRIKATWPEYWQKYAELGATLRDAERALDAKTGGAK